METKKFSLRTILTVTTSRLLTVPKDGGNGIGDLYDILSWMTNDNLFTHQLPRCGNECKPWLLKWFPELAACGVQKSLNSLDRWIKADKTGTGDEGIKMWITELKMMFPNIKDEYEVKRIPKKSHKHINPVVELNDMMRKK